MAGADQRGRLLAALLLAAGCGQACARAEASDEPTPKTAVSGAGSSPAAALAPRSTPSRSALPPKASVAPPVEKAPVAPECREQPAQEFLMRKNHVTRIGAPKAEREAIEKVRARAVAYRTKHYGRFPGFGSRKDNPHPPQFYAKRTKFMGHVLVLSEKVVPVLRCVETALKRDCADHPYKPRQVSGLRLENTFKDYEVSNHVYGIALDIDSQLNPCCGCVGKWNQAAACKKEVESVYERMAMPRCWVEVFERYGFYWLGHDELEDTMHFEFLGEPE